MAGTGLEVRIESEGLERLNKRLAEMTAGLKDFGPLLEGLGAEVESQARRRISEEKASPDGTPWQPWSEAYGETRRGGHSLLEGEGDLLDSIQYVVDGDRVEIGSNLIYAAIHQHGGDDVGIPIPARPYLGISPENEEDLVAIIDDWARQQLRG